MYHEIFFIIKIFNNFNDYKIKIYLFIMMLLTFDFKEFMHLELM